MMPTVRPASKSEGAWRGYMDQLNLAQGKYGSESRFRDLDASCCEGGREGVREEGVLSRRLMQAGI